MTLRMQKIRTWLAHETAQSEPVMNPLPTPHGFNYSCIGLDGVVPETKDWNNLNDSLLHGSDT